MDSRERWQTIQSRLASARALIEAGDRAGALQEIERALAIDPEFLAAHSLRDRITAGPAADPRSPALTAFESRARARRAERRLAAANEAIARRDFASAAEAVEEARELGADSAALLRVDEALAQARLSRPQRALTSRPTVAAATLLVAMLGANYVGERSTDELPARPTIAATPSTASGVEPAGPANLDAHAVATTGVSRVEPVTEVVKLQPTQRPPTSLPAPQAPRLPAGTAVASNTVSVERSPEPSPRPAVPAVEMPSASSVIAPIAAPEEPPARMASVSVTAANRDAAVPALSTPAAEFAPPARSIDATPARAVEVTPARPVEDDSGVRAALQRYRAAYDELNARSARAVWPAVDERALAQAFSGLASQQLIFDACDVRLRGENATATCRGTARYVPKVGSSEPQVEPRTWKFTLRKAGGDWAIDTARADR